MRPTSFRCIVAALLLAPLGGVAFAAVPPAAPAPADAAAAQAALEREYAQDIHVRVLQQWAVPASVQPGQRCTLTINQVVGGRVVSATPTADCSFDDVGRDSIVAAVLRTELPYRGYERVFRRTFSLKFAAPDVPAAGQGTGIR